MSRKGKKRRDAERRRRKQESGAAEQQPPQQSAGDVGERQPATRQAARPPKPKRRPRKAGHVAIGPWEVPTRTLAGWGAGLAMIGAVALVAVLIATSGSSGVAPPPVTATPDPRVEGLTPTTTLQLEAGGSDFDAYFNPTTLNATAGEAIEIVIENTGSLSHNLTVAGADGTYDTDDDWVSRPTLIEPGGEGALVLKIDEPGTYPFRCSLHPDVQFGELILQ